MLAPVVLLTQIRTCLSRACEFEVWMCHLDCKVARIVSMTRSGSAVDGCRGYPLLASEITRLPSLRQNAAVLWRRVRRLRKS